MSVVLLVVMAPSARHYGLLPDHLARVRRRPGGRRALRHLAGGAAA